MMIPRHAIAAATLPFTLALLLGLLFHANAVVTTARGDTPPAAALAVAALFTDHAVLQRDRPVPVWGTAAPGERVTVAFAGAERSAVTGSDGRWKIVLPPVSASSSPRDLVIQGAPDRAITLTDVVVGDVWLCSGQSNMGMSVAGCRDADAEIASGDHPSIREFKVSVQSSLTPLTDVTGNWTPCSPKTVGGFSGVAYFFGRELQRELNVPIGIVVSSVGATPAEAWTRLEALRTVPEVGARADDEIKRVQSQEEDNRRFLVARAAWEEKYGVKPPPLSEAARGWA